MSIFFFQSSATPVMEAITDLHNHIFFFLVIILVFVGTIFFLILRDFCVDFSKPYSRNSVSSVVYFFPVRRVTHAPILETIWTILPSIVLFLIAVPSFALLYVMDEVIDPQVTIKIIGHQWYWSYEVPVALGLSQIVYDSYMIPESELKPGMRRLLEVDKPLVFPTNCDIRLLVTALDVLHSWAVPSLGVKMDAVPGRISQVPVHIKHSGVYRGQCSELCGVNHGFMPITVKAVPFEDFVDYYKPVSSV